MLPILCGECHRSAASAAPAGFQWQWLQANLPPGVAEANVPEMVVKRRLGTESARNRQLLVEAAERLMVEEGAAAITSRKVAEKAGLKMPLVYYYFHTMDDLIVEVMREHAARRLKGFVRALAAKDPFKALWEMNRDRSFANFNTELLALANQRERVRAELVTRAREFRALQIEAVDRLLAERGVDREQVPAGAIVTIIGALTRAMAQDRAYGVDDGYDEAVALVHKALEWLAAKEATSKQ